jgi:hypothetical protein
MPPHMTEDGGARVRLAYICAAFPTRTQSQFATSIAFVREITDPDKLRK